MGRRPQAEAGAPARTHEAAFRLATKHFMAKTVHAGEAWGPSSIYQAVADLGSDRIGHGMSWLTAAILIENAYCNCSHVATWLHRQCLLPLLLVVVVVAVAVVVICQQRCAAVLIAPPPRSAAAGYHLFSADRLPVRDAAHRVDTVTVLHSKNCGNCLTRKGESLSL